MEDLKNMLKESIEFYLAQQRSIAAQITSLPKGNIRQKKIGREIYYYLQYRKGKKVRKYKLYVDRTHDEQLQEQLSFLQEYIADHPEFLQIIESKKGSAIISDLITDNFPDSVVTERKVYTAIIRRLFEKGLLTKEKDKENKRSFRWKKKFYTLLRYWFKNNEHDATKIMSIAPKLGFSNMNSIRSFISQNKGIFESD